MKFDELIIYENDSILIINKPQGLATGIGQKYNLCNLVFSNKKDLLNVNGYRKGEGGLLNRLDNETGGIVLFAKNDEAFKYYNKEMKNDNAEKIYTAVVNGIPDKYYGIIKYSIAHQYKNIKKMIVVNNQSNIKYRGKPRKAVTEWKLLRSRDNISILEVIIKKGLRHQIRVHLSYIGLPIIGDKLYNKNQNKFNFENHLLYANGIRFIPYGKNEKIEILVDVPFLNEIDKVF